MATEADMAIRGVEDKEGGWQQQQHHGYPSTPNPGSSSLSLQNRYSVLSDSSSGLQEPTNFHVYWADFGVHSSQETLKHENYGNNFPPIIENNDSVDSNSRDRRSQPGAILSTMGWSSIPVSSPNSTSSQSTTQTTSSTSFHVQDRHQPIIPGDVSLVYWNTNGWTKENGLVKEGVLLNTNAGIICFGETHLRDKEELIWL